MSLIGEALKRARQEAAYQEAARDGRTWGPPPVYTAPRRRIWPLVAAGVAAGALLVGAVGGGVYWMATRDGREAAEVAARNTPPGAVPPGATPVIEELDPSLSTAAPSLGTEAREAVPPGGLPAIPAPLPVPTEPAARPLPPATIPVPRPERSPAPVEVAPPGSQLPAEAVPAPPVQPPGGAQESRPVPPAEAPPSAPQVPSPGVSTEPAPAAPADPAGGGEPTAPAHAGEVQTYVGSAPLPDGGKLELTGIAFSQDQPVALINGRVMGVGEGIQGYTLVRIADGQVELRGRGTTLVLRVQ